MISNDLNNSTNKIKNKSLENDNLQYSKEDFIYMCKLCERIKNYDLMFNYFYQLVKLHYQNSVFTLNLEKKIKSNSPDLNLLNLSDEEILIFQTAYKKLFTYKLDIWKKFNKIRKNEEVKIKSVNIKLNYLKNVDKKVCDEMLLLSNKTNEICDILILNIEKINGDEKFKNYENLALYYKLKGDTHRYLNCIFNNKSINEYYIAEIEKNYRKAYDIAEMNLKLNSYNRISIAINFSLFYYEIKKNIDYAFTIARLMLRELLKIEKTLVKESGILNLIEILKNNIRNWENKCEFEIMIF